MGYSNPSNTVAIRNAIINQLISELNPASGGRLVGVQAVGRAWLNGPDVYPYIGVCDTTATWQNFAVRQRYKTDTFAISLAYQSTISLEDAYDNVHRLLDDGNGNGLEVVLSDPTLYSWGGLAHVSFVMERQLRDNYGMDKQASTAGFVAYGLVRYDVKSTVFFNGPVM